MEENRTVIDAEHVTVRFNMAGQSVNNLKEYVIRLAKRELMFQEFLALKDVSLKVRAGESWGIIGRNAAGKYAGSGWSGCCMCRILMSWRAGCAAMRCEIKQGRKRRKTWLFKGFYFRRLVNARNRNCISGKQPVRGCRRENPGNAEGQHKESAIITVKEACVLRKASRLALIRILTDARLTNGRNTRF